MCVIGIVKDRKVQRISPDILKEMERANPDGGGIAWREKGRVNWGKNLTAEEISDITAQIRGPFVFHFRLASMGGKSPYLTHPFPITSQVKPVLRGQSNEVLFHNGHWTGWETALITLLINKKVRLPKGAWSDSRGLALLAYHCGSEIFNLLSEKIVIFSRGGIKIWGKFEIVKDGEREISVSNTFYRKVIGPVSWENYFDKRYRFHSSKLDDNWND